MKKYQDAFLFEDSALVISVDSAGPDLKVIFDDTLFYPGGGGQPCDTGLIVSQGFEGRVISADKKDGAVVHLVRPSRGTLAAGDRVHLTVDKERRIRLLKMHTGEHILFKSLELALGQITLDKIDLAEDESSLFIKAASVDWDSILKAEATANRIIAEDRAIIEKEVPREEALAMPHLRIKADRIPGDTIRVVEVKGFDWSACTGTHAKSTGYVKSLLITKCNQAKGSWELRFRTDCLPALFEYAAVGRRAISAAGQPDPSAEIARTRQESESWKDRFRKLSAKLLDTHAAEHLGHLTFRHAVVEEVERKQLIDKANELLEEKTVVCFAGTAEGRGTVILAASLDLSLDIPKILQEALAPLGGKGGGKDRFAMGSVEAAKTGEAIAAVRNMLSSLRA